MLSILSNNNFYNQSIRSIETGRLLAGGCKHQLLRGQARAAVPVIIAAVEALVGIVGVAFPHIARVGEGVCHGEQWS